MSHSKTQSHLVSCQDSARGTSWCVVIEKSSIIRLGGVVTPSLYLHAMPSPQSRCVRMPSHSHNQQQGLIGSGINYCTAYSCRKHSDLFKPLTLHLLQAACSAIIYARPEYHTRSHTRQATLARALNILGVYSRTPLLASPLLASSISITPLLV